MIFVFDLDGTLTACETLPLIAKAFKVEAEIEALTAQTVKGDIPFMESFIRRVEILGHLDTQKVAALLSTVTIDDHINNFITENQTSCIVATGNYRGWISELAKKISCPLVCSEGAPDTTGKVRLTKILKKEDVVREYQARGEKVVFVGDGNNDAEAMRIADISIACGIIHAPAQSVMQVADYAVYDARALVRLLNQIKQPQDGMSVIISAAGVGSRLGLGQTKSLIKLAGTSLINLQLNYFSAIEDLRIVVGFQAKDLIEAVLARRKDVIFVFNHDYFHTKTGTSLYLGSRHANAMIVAWDGDLLVHPGDIERCLDTSQEYIGISEKTSDDTVFVNLDEHANVVAFSRENGDYEWSGPACLQRDSIHFTSGHVYALIEPRLPMPSKIIDARDIDTYEDYKRALSFIASWERGNTKIHDYYAKLANRIQSPTETRNKAPDFSQFDINFVARYADKKYSLLDLGAGTGLLINSLTDRFARILAVEKYPEFSKFIKAADNVSVINSDLLTFAETEHFDRITIFGVMNFFNEKEAAAIYQKARNWMKPDGVMLVKHQMGCDDDVTVDGYSQELDTNYYSEYRWFKKEIKLINQAGFDVAETVDIYPPEFNRWKNTHFYALVCRPKA